MEGFLSKSHQFPHDAVGKRLLEQLEGSTAGRWVKLVLLGAVFALSLLAMTGSTMQAFIYAQF